MRFDFSFVNQRNSRIAGFVLALCFVGFTLLSTNKLIQRIQENERQQMELWGIAQQELATSTDLNKPVNPLTFKVLTGENTIPMIVVDHDNKLLFSNNIDSTRYQIFRISCKLFFSDYLAIKCIPLHSFA